MKKSFGSLDVLKGIDLTIAEREVVVIIGPSGSGKSTLLRCINYLEEPTGGSIVIDGIPLTGEANINEIRKEVGMVLPAVQFISAYDGVGELNAGADEGAQHQPC